MSGYNDPEKLKAARELAQGFSQAKDPKKKKSVGGSGQGPRQERWEPHPAAQLTRYGQITAQPWQSGSSSGSSAPPPSQRTYSSSASFSTGRAGKSTVIGSLGVDFINESIVRSLDIKKTQTSPASVPSLTNNAVQQTENSGNSTVTNAHLSTTSPQLPGNAPCGNILDAFYSIVAKKPKLGEEIDTLAKILPKALDLNAKGTESLDTSPVKDSSSSNVGQCTCQGRNGKGIHEIACPLSTAQEKSIKKANEMRGNGDVKASDVNKTPKRSSVEASQNRATSYSHSRKLSPVALAFEPSNNEVRGQTAGANGESKASATKKTKGLSASMWA